MPTRNESERKDYSTALFALFLVAAAAFIILKDLGILRL